MFIAILGSKSSGKTTVQNYLLDNKKFTLLRICRDQRGQPAPRGDNSEGLFFSTALDLLNHVTRHWRSHFVTGDLTRRDIIEIFVRRPFFMLVYVDAPVLLRFKRSVTEKLTLEDFVMQHDVESFGHLESPSAGTRDIDADPSSLSSIRDLVNLRITNSFPSISDFHAYLDGLNLLHPGHLRPSWDAYFMMLASLASHRSNCMKRRVGAILVRENRIVATGYNGTPRGLVNCNEGGCPHCNRASSPNSSYECLCLHAEENALLEAGRERVGQGGVLYCNTCPCLKCTIKIIQTGVKEVVYNLTYKVDEESARLFDHAGVKIRQYVVQEEANFLPVSNS
ncbi:hypothetical protein HGRIS_008247 [Hohenbuehelia grisea]|uniref:dCMP deaminase n=1 Tax=Hohenbuehelia grisea TaxID=104357 RepID=A0ABR3J8V2_9AGAR